MPSYKSYLDFVLEQLADLKDITYRVMMGEFIIYYQGKVIGGIYDNRFLVKPTKSAIKMMTNAKREFPYPGAKAMLLVDNLEDKVFLHKLFDAIAKELPLNKKHKI